MENTKIEVFRRSFCFSKKDLLKSFSKFMKHEYNQFTPNIGRIYESFYSHLKEARLPTIQDPLWYYDYTLMHDSLELELCQCSDIELDENGELSSVDTQDVQLLFKISCEYLNVEQYAKMHKVSVAKINRLIKHGQLRSAKKRNADWYIPEIMPLPSPTDFFGNYAVESEYSQETLMLYPFLQGSKFVLVYSNHGEKNEYEVCISFENGRLKNTFKLNKKEGEEFEVQLMSDSNVKLCDSLCTFICDVR